MIDLLGIAVTGLSRGIAQFTNAAVSVTETMTTGRGGLIDAVITETVSGVTLKADIAVTKATDTAVGTLLDILA